VIKNEYTLNVDIKKKNSIIVPTFVQYDNGVLRFKVFDGGNPFNFTGYTSIKIYHRRKDNVVVEGDATVEVIGGQEYIVYRYKGNEMAKLGLVSTSLSIISGDKKVSIQPFNVSIADNIGDSVASPSNPEYGALQNLIVSVQNLIDSVNVEITKTINASTEQTNHAKTQGDYAKVQGDYAKKTGDENKNTVLSPVATFAAIATTYKNPVLGMKVQVTTGIDAGKFYRYQNGKWEHVETNDNSILADIQNQLIKVGNTPPLGTATFWLDTSIE